MNSKSYNSLSPCGAGYVFWFLLMLLVIICHVLSCPSLSCGLCQFQLKTGLTFVSGVSSNEHGQIQCVVLVLVIQRYPCQYDVICQLGLLTGHSRSALHFLVIVLNG